MPDFSYTARQATGQLTNGIITAPTEAEALSQLSAQKLFPMKIGLSQASIQQEVQSNRRVKQRLLANFYGQLADLLRSGVPLLRALELLERQSKNPPLKAVLAEVKEDVSQGIGCAEALRKHPKAFSPLVVSMIRAGEEGGFLEDVLRRVANLTEHQEEIKAQVMGAMIYPFLLLIIGTVIVIIMLIVVVPQFQPIFNTMAAKGQLPTATTILLGFSDTLQKYWLIIFAALAGIYYFAKQYLDTKEGQRNFDQFLLNIPAWGTIVRNLAISRFCRMLGTMLHNGVPILQSLKISSDATGNMILGEAILEASEHLTTGKSLAQPLAESKQFPEEIVEMISVGEESNNLEEVLVNISENLERRTSRELEMAVRLLEPLLLMLMGVAVLFIAIALLLPILQSSSIM
jgi:general secretion pathway protein F/type IV pilus assembly protein PilC